MLKCIHFELASEMPVFTLHCVALTVNYISNTKMYFGDLSFAYFLLIHLYLVFLFLLIYHIWSQLSIQLLAKVHIKNCSFPRNNSNPQKA